MKADIKEDILEFVTSNHMKTAINMLTAHIEEMKKKVIQTNSEDIDRLQSQKAKLEGAIALYNAFCNHKGE